MQAGFAAPVAQATRPQHGPLSPVPIYRDASVFKSVSITDAQINDHISAHLSAQEKAVIRSVMLQLPYNKRSNVIHYALDGKVYTNDPALLAETKIYKPTSKNSRVGVATNDASTIALAPTISVPQAASYNCYSPPNSTSTGGYRGIYSTCSTPFDYSNVYLPCRSNGQIYLAYPNNEVVYTYLGGFSGNGNAIDAGMQHSWTYDNWALFIAGARGQVSSYSRFQCNQRIAIEFYPASTTLVASDVTGYTTSGSYTTITQTYAVLQAESWSPSCPYCVVKRITSLSQKGFLNFQDGSYAGVDVYANPTVAWSNSYVGFWTGSYPARFNAYTWTSRYTGSYQNYPNDNSRVLVNFVNQATETDGLDYHH